MKLLTRFWLWIQGYKVGEFVYYKRPLPDYDKIYTTAFNNVKTRLMEQTFTTSPLWKILEAQAEPMETKK